VSLISCVHPYLAFIRSYQNGTVLKRGMRIHHHTFLGREFGVSYDAVESGRQRKICSCNSSSSQRIPQPVVENRGPPLSWEFFFTGCFNMRSVAQHLDQSNFLSYLELLPRNWVGQPSSSPRRRTFLFRNPNDHMTTTEN